MRQCADGCCRCDTVLPDGFLVPPHAVVNAVAQHAYVFVHHHFDQQQVVCGGKPSCCGAEAITGQALGHDTEVPEVDQAALEMQA